MRQVFYAATLGVALLAGGAASASTIVVNGSFEADAGPGTTKNNRTGAVNYVDMPTSGPSWGIWDDLPGWTGAGGSGIEVQTDRTLGSIDSQDGDYYVELDTNRNSSMSQLVSLDAGVYELSFWYSPRTNNPATTGIDYSLGALFSENVSGPSGSYPRGVWTEVVERFEVLADGDYLMTFEATGTSNSLGGLLDNVSISAVPLPAGAVLMLTALGALAVGRRRA